MLVSEFVNAGGQLGLTAINALTDGFVTMPHDSKRRLEDAPYGEQDIERRRDEALRRALNTPPKPLKDVQRKGKKAQPKADKSSKRKPAG